MSFLSFSLSAVKRKQKRFAPTSQSYEVGHVSCRRGKLTHHSDCGITEVTITTAKMTVKKKNLCPVTALDPVCLYFNNFWWVLSGFEEQKVPLVMMSMFVEHSPGVPRMIKAMAHEHQDRGGRHQRGQLSAGMVGDMFQSSPLTGRLAAGPQVDSQLTRLTQLRHCKNAPGSGFLLISQQLPDIIWVSKELLY